MKNIGEAKHTPNNTFSFFGNIHGKIIVVYVEKIHSHTKLIFKEPESEQELATIIESVNRMSKYIPPIQHRKVTPNQKIPGLFND